MHVVDHSMRMLIVGDTHGNIGWLSNYIIPLSEALNVDRILVLGDFGYWEHTPAGVSFLDVLDEVLPVPLYWLHGNHDNATLAMKKYGQDRDAEGFVRIRGQILYIPQGHSWTWSGTSMRSFGGAYSVDKDYRLRMERKQHENAERSEQRRAAALGVMPRPVRSTSGTLWFPEEQMTDTEMDKLLAEDRSRKDIVFSHDKPAKARPRWDRKDLPLCRPNQERLQRALDVHRPRYWFHGHLHYWYLDKVGETMVVGLAPDDEAREPNWSRTQNWSVMDLSDDGFTVRHGEAFENDELAEIHKQVFA